MKKLSILGAALALAIPATALAAADCCAGMACCKDGADCCKDRKADCCNEMKMGGDHAGHDMQAAAAK